MQTVKDLDSVRQFCVILPYGGMNNGADFSDLPDIDNGTDKGIIADEIKLSPYFILGILTKIPN